MFFCNAKNKSEKKRKEMLEFLHKVSADFVDKTAICMKNREHSWERYPRPQSHILNYKCAICGIVTRFREAQNTQLLNRINGGSNA